MAEGARLILASGSAARKHMLTAAGLDFEVVPSQADEASLKEDWFRESEHASVRDLAQMLAAAKAKEVSERHADALVIGGDQVLALGERLISKARDREGAKRTLQTLRGQRHDLHSAVALATGGHVIWCQSATAHMTMRQFSDAWLENYLDAAGHALTRSVGAYELEALGIQMFDQIDGDYFTILGMPLLPLLAELRRRGALTQ